MTIINNSISFIANLVQLHQLFTSPSFVGSVPFIFLFEFFFYHVLVVVNHRDHWCFVPWILANFISSKEGILGLPYTIPLRKKEKGQMNSHSLCACIYHSCIQAVEAKKADIFCLNWVQIKRGTGAMHLCVLSELGGSFNYLADRIAQVQINEDRLYSLCCHIVICYALSSTAYTT